jgi:conjugal transfer ATP-binding protein TraC
MSARLSDQLQIWGFEEDMILFSDGSLGFGLEVTPIDITCWSEERVNRLSERLSQFLNGLPSGISLQFVQDIGRGNTETLELHGTLATSNQSEVAKELTEGRIQRGLELEKQGLIPKHSLRIFVRRTAAPLLGKPRLFSRTKLFEPIAESKLEYELSGLKQLREAMVRELGALEIAVAGLNADRLTDLVYSQWNPTRSIDRGTYDPHDVRGSLIFTDVNVSQKGFALSDMHHRVISLKILPDETFISMTRVLRELPFDSRLFLSVLVPDQHSEISSLQTQRRLAFSMAKGKKTGVSDLESEAKLSDLETLLEQMIAQGEKVFHVSLNILLRSQDKELLERQVSETLMKVRELSGAEGMEESLAAFDIFLDFSIPNARGKERAKRVKTSNLAHLLPIFGPWPGHESPSILLRSRFGSLVSFDPFSPVLSNYNHVISGGSGSGKSFLTNILLLQMLKEDPSIFIIDIGGSYRKLCENLDGQNIALGADLDLSINPFDLADNEKTPSNHKIKFLVGLMELMTKEEGDNRLPRFERAEVEEAIERTYQQPTPPRLSITRDLLLKHDSNEIKRLGRILTPWCGNTPFGRFLDKETTIQLNRPIVAFDLKGMEAYPDLQSVALFIITDLVWRQVQRDRNRKKFLIFDECWRLLENESGSQFIGEVFRTFRKYYAGTIAISQNIDDFAKSKVSTAILSNSSMKWCLMQKGANQMRLKDVLQLNDTELMLVNSLSQERGLYSEVFLMAEDHHSVVMVEPTPLEYWIATTYPKDLFAWEEMAKQNPGISKLGILKRLSEKYPRGVTA